MLPFGYSNQLRIFIDLDLLQYDEVWAAAGMWKGVFSIAPNHLVPGSGEAITDPKPSWLSRTFIWVKSTFEVRPVGVVRCSRSQPEDDQWDAEISNIELLEPFNERAVLGLATFSHCIVVYVFDKATWDISRMSRHPRGNSDWPEVGIFAQRAKDRPNRLGVTVCRIISIDGSVIHVSGLDAIDGSPVVDIKPWMSEFGPRGTVVQPQWSEELMKGYW